MQQVQGKKIRMKIIFKNLQNILQYHVLILQQLEKLNFNLLLCGKNPVKSLPDSLILKHVGVFMGVFFFFFMSCLVGVVCSVLKAVHIRT